MDMSQYLEVFIEESKEHLQEMNEILLKLEQDFTDIGLLNDIFRVAHTIKGMSGTMGFNKVASLTHEMENVLHICRSKELEVDDIIIDTLFECFDGLETYIDHLTKQGTEGDLDTSSLVNKLNYIAKNKSTKGLADMPEPAAKVETQPAAALPTDAEEYSMDVTGFSEDMIKDIREQGIVPLQIKVVLTKDCALKAARVFLTFNILEQFGDVVRTLPDAEDLEQEKFEQAFEILYLSKLDINMIREELSHVSEVEKVFAKELTVEELTAAPAPKAEEAIADSQTGEEQKEEAPTSENAQAEEEAPVIRRGAQAKQEEHKDDKKKPQASKTVRVDIDRLDNLMNLVSELIIIKTRLDDYESMDNRKNLTDAIEYLERITTSLHDAVMKVRMVPVERTFNRFPRLVRDLSKDLGKKIRLVMTGEETEVDRTVIDEIGDPLIHLIRNSIDHGIENDEVRKERGKPEEGTVHLMAYPDGNSVVIEVKDDGNGIDVDKVAQKCVQKGLVTVEQVETMTDHEIINMLFLPGFSMAKQITDISGRGVGLDVVKSKIEALSGTVEVQSKFGEGSTFIIRLPLTLAIIQALMVNLGEEKYAIPLNNIKIITTIKADAISRVQNQEVVLYRNKTLPIIRLAEELEVPDHVQEGDTLTVVIVRKGQIEAGLVVDGLIGQQEIVIKSLGKYLGGIKAIAGATILGNGGVALIVDPNQLI